MPLRVLIIPDKFKGTLTASAAAQAIARGWRRARPTDSLVLLPMSDGGDGFGEVMGGLLGGLPQRLRTVDAAHRPCRAKWWWAPRSRIAVIESAAVIGLAMLPHGRFHPFELDTFGLGALLRAAWRTGARRCLVGIGGSATNDGGFGLARSLGWRFLDGDGEEIVDWTHLPRLHRIQGPRGGARSGRMLVAVDVGNRLLGRHGATRVFGPQKGLRPEQFKRSEQALRRLARVCFEQHGHDFASEAGAGAAGGLGFGLSAFLGGRLTPGFALFAGYAGLERHLRSTDLVITGEGAIDPSTLMGKGVGEIARRCQVLGIPCLGFAGNAIRTQNVRSAFRAIYSLAELASVEQARSRPGIWLERMACAVARGGRSAPTTVGDYGSREVLTDPTSGARIRRTQSAPTSVGDYEGGDSLVQAGRSGESRGAS